MTSRINEREQLHLWELFHAHRWDDMVHLLDDISRRPSSFGRYDMKTLNRLFTVNNPSLYPRQPHVLPQTEEAVIAPIRVLRALLNVYPEGLQVSIPVELLHGGIQSQEQLPNDNGSITSGFHLGHGLRVMYPIHLALKLGASVECIRLMVQRNPAVTRQSGFDPDLPRIAHSTTFFWALQNIQAYDTAGSNEDNTNTVYDVILNHSSPPYTMDDYMCTPDGSITDADVLDPLLGDRYGISFACGGGNVINARTRTANHDNDEENEGHHPDAHDAAPVRVGLLLNETALYSIRRYDRTALEYRGGSYEAINPVDASASFVSERLLPIHLLAMYGVHHLEGYERNQERMHHEKEKACRMLEALLEVFPDSAKIIYKGPPAINAAVTKWRFTMQHALHMAVQNGEHSLDFLQLLVNENPQGVLTADAQGDTPLALALRASQNNGRLNGHFRQSNWKYVGLLLQHIQEMMGNQDGTPTAVPGVSSIAQQRRPRTGQYLLHKVMEALRYKWRLDAVITSLDSTPMDVTEASGEVQELVQILELVIHLYPQAMSYNVCSIDGTLPFGYAWDTLEHGTVDKELFSPKRLYFWSHISAEFWNAWYRWFMWSMSTTSAPPHSGWTNEECHFLTLQDYTRCSPLVLVMMSTINYSIYSNSTAQMLDEQLLNEDFSVLFLLEKSSLALQQSQIQADLKLNSILRWRSVQHSYPLPPGITTASSFRTQVEFVINQFMYCHKLFDATQFHEVMKHAVLPLFLRALEQEEDEYMEGNDSSMIPNDGLNNNWLHYFILAPTPSKILLNRRDKNGMTFEKPWMSLKELLECVLSMDLYNHPNNNNDRHFERPFSPSSTDELLRKAARRHNERGELPLHTWIKRCRTKDPARVLSITEEGLPPTDNGLIVEQPPHPRQELFVTEINQPAPDQHLAGDGTWLLLKASPTAASTPQQGGTHMYPFMLAAASSFDDVSRNRRRNHNSFTFLPAINTAATREDGNTRLNPPCLTTTYRLLQDGGLTAILSRSAA